MNKKNIPLLSFFTGGGLLDIGFEKAGFDVVWSNEINPDFADLHDFGMLTWHNSEGRTNRSITQRGSIETIDPIEVKKQAFNKSEPKFFGVIGGPPCPDFSAAGKNKGRHGTNGKLFEVFVRYICKIKPTFFVIENVLGLYRNRAHREYLDFVLEILRRAHYAIDIKILNALDLGVPQDRERLFVIGMRKEIVQKRLNKKISKNHAWFPWPENPKYKNAKRKYDWPTAIPFGGNPKKPSNIPLELMVGHWLNGKNPPQNHPNGNEYFQAHSKKFSYVAEGDTKRKSFKRLHRYKYSPTACYGNNEVHLHPWEKRRLSVREVMRIQGVPDSYVLCKEKPLSSKYRLIANGVPVPLAYEVAKALRSFLKK